MKTANGEMQAGNARKIAADVLLGLQCACLAEAQRARAGPASSHGSEPKSMGNRVFTNDSERLARFEREARMLAELQA
jgi:hypothetical protein